MNSPVNDSYGRKWQIQRSDVPLLLDDHQVSSLCVIAAFSHFWLWAKLRKFKVRTTPPASRAHLSIEEKQQKIRVASWIALGSQRLLVQDGAFRHHTLPTSPNLKLLVEECPAVADGFVSQCL